ncbi:MAG TPA: M1 family aminopeptidase [Candidatus Acidoferrum sp.]|nr:M1 family aminopeptidase [Candidatus Acidoferrum sp.]
MSLRLARALIASAQMQAGKVCRKFFPSNLASVNGTVPCCILRAAAAAAFLLTVGFSAPGQTGANSDPAYVALRNLTLGGEAVQVSNLYLKRDAGTLRLNSGTVCFVAPVNGKVTGAVFTGDGAFLLNPPTEGERKSLKYLTKEDEFNEKFEHLVLRFTDSTYDDIKKAGTAATGGCDAGLLKDSQNTTRHRIKHNLEADLLAEVLSPEPRSLFVAFIHGKRYDDKEIYELDPNQDSDQVDFWTYDENKWGDWASFGFSESHPKGSVGRNIRIEHHQLDTTLEKTGALSGKATTTFVALRNGLRVVPFDLFHTLRVQSVTADGQALPFIQEDKNDDADFAVILPKPLSAGETFSLTTVYSGKDAVSNEGGGNYFPVARQDWYPNNVGGAFGEYATYDMTFHIPKGMKIAATGALISDSNEGGANVSVWKSEAPQTVAGFSYGRFKVEEAKLTKPPMFIQSFANEESPDWVQSVQRSTTSELPGDSPVTGVALGTMSTVSLNKKALAEGELAVQLYTDYFGPSLFTHLQITQQTACSFGQSWPGLVWIPICYYFDNTVRHALGIDWGDRGYWKVVTPHEVAHQWWGHTVGFSSARDQWMSEGFADMSAALYLSMLEHDQKKFNAFWKDERELLVERDAQGYRAIDAGSLTMGYRASNYRTGGGITRRLIYPKGAFVLHMIRMMMYDRRDGDKYFKEMMQDFVATYRGKAATTEDFKAMVEKHMDRPMDLDGNHKMDWFFNQYVYGTGEPEYTFNVSAQPTPDGKTQVKGEITRTGVPATWKDVIPLYAHVGDKTIRLGTIAATHATEPLDVTIAAKLDRVSINDYQDLLAEVKP